MEDKNSIIKDIIVGEKMTLGQSLDRALGKFSRSNGNVETKVIEQERKETPVNQENRSLKGMMEELLETNKQLVEQKKQKKFRLPWMSRVGKVKSKQGYATFCYIKENKEVEFFRARIDEGAIRKDDNFHLATAEYGLTYKGKPLYIIPSWNIEPFSPQKNIEEAEREKKTTVGQRYIFNKMKMDIIKDPKKNIPWGPVLIGLLVIGGLIYMMQKGGFKLF